MYHNYERKPIIYLPWPMVENIMTLKRISQHCDKLASVCNTYLNT